MAPTTRTIAAVVQMRTKKLDTLRKSEPITYWPQAMLLFRVLIQGHRPDEFNALWQRQLEHAYPERHGEQRIIGGFAATFPKIHLLNDLVGVAEMFWDGGRRILADFYFRADSRRKFGRLLKSRSSARLNPRRFCMLCHAVEIGGLPLYSTETERRKDLLDALHRVEAEAADLGCHADTSVEQHLVQHLDLAALFHDNQASP